VLSYARQLNFDIVGDIDAIPDLAVFAEGLADALQQLGTGRCKPILIGCGSPGGALK
jgi:hypothetical protein